MPVRDSISSVSRPLRRHGGELAVPATVPESAPAGAVSMMEEAMPPHLLSSFCGGAVRADTATAAVSPSGATAAGPAAAPTSVSLTIAPEMPSVAAARVATLLLFERKRALRRLLKSVLTVSQPGPYSDEILRRSRGYLLFPSPLFSSFVMRIFSLCKRSLSVPTFSRCQPGAQLLQLRNALQNSSLLRKQWHTLMLPVQHALTTLRIESLMETTIAYITLSAFCRFSRHQIDSMLTVQEHAVGGVLRKAVAIADAAAAVVGAAVAAVMRTASSPLSTTPTWTIDQPPPAPSATSARASAAANGSAPLPSSLRAAASDVSAKISDDEMLSMLLAGDDDSDDDMSVADVELEDDEHPVVHVDSLDYCDDEL